MDLLQTHDITCPYCWQEITLMVDCSVSQQRYVEDCHVCCRPILVAMHLDEDGEAWLDAQPENY